jgi:hypothetical protein
MSQYSPNSVIKRSRAERKKLGIERVVPPKVVAAPSPPSIETKPEPESEPESESDIVSEILQEREENMQVPKIALTPKTKKKPVKKKAVKKSDKKKTTSRGKNVKVAELDQEELSDLFSGPTSTVDDDDDE